MKRIIVPISVACILACSFPSVWAYPIGGVYMPLSQPNGLEFIGRWYGDEFFNWTETEEGYTFVKNYDDGYYYYAVLGSDGDYGVNPYFETSS